MREEHEARIRAAQRGTMGGSQDAAIQRAVSSYLDRYLGQTLRDFSIIKEKVETMRGERGTNDTRAVLRKDMDQLRFIPAEPESRTITGAPTEADYNALVRDMRLLYLRLNAIAVLLSR